MVLKKVYDEEFEVQAVSLEGRSVSANLQKSLVSIQIRFMAGINAKRTQGWILEREAIRRDTAMSLTEEVQKLRLQNREQATEIARLKEENCALLSCAWCNKAGILLVFETPE